MDYIETFLQLAIVFMSGIVFDQTVLRRLLNWMDNNKKQNEKIIYLDHHLRNVMTEHDLVREKRKAEMDELRAIYLTPVVDLFPTEQPVTESSVVETEEKEYIPLGQRYARSDMDKKWNEYFNKRKAVA